MTAPAANLLVMCGATGDLAQRMLLPSLYSLQRDGLLPPKLRILATARSPYDDEGFRKVVAGILPKELNVTTNAVEEMSDDELAAGIAALQSILAAQAAREGSEPETKH